MTNEEKIKVFEKYLNMIESNEIRAFTEFCIVRFPDYFWTMPASTTGKHHGKDETLIDHVNLCLYLVENVCRQFDGVWTQRQKDQLVSAVILHDGWKCGPGGNETRFTQEIITKRGYSQDLLGKPMTTRDHPEVGYKQLVMLSAEYNLLATKNKTKIIGARDLKPILDGVRLHYGKWLHVKEKPFSLDWPYSNISVQVHNLDYMATACAKYFTR